MYPGCLANSVRWSIKWLIQHMLFIVNFVETLVSEDFLYDKKT